MTHYELAIINDETDERMDSHDAEDESALKAKMAALDELGYMDYPYYVEVRSVESHPLAQTTVNLSDEEVEKELAEVKDALEEDCIERYV